MEDAKNSMLLQSVDGFVPVLLSLLPETIRNKHICSLVYESLRNFTHPQFKSIADQLVYIQNDLNQDSPFYTLLGICEYLTNITEDDQHNPNQSNRKIYEIKQLNTVLSLPANTIIEKNIKFKLANIDVSESIKKAVSNGYTYEMCDKILHYLHTMIFKFLSLKVSEITVSEISKIFKTI